MYLTARQQPKLFSQPVDNIRPLAKAIGLDGSGCSSIGLAGQQLAVRGGQDPDLVPKAGWFPSHELFEGVRAEIFYHSLIHCNMLWLPDKLLGSGVELVKKHPNFPEPVVRVGRVEAKWV